VTLGALCIVLVALVIPLFGYALDATMYARKLERLLDAEITAHAATRAELADAKCGAKTGFVS
jgi:hypothetical protein